MYMKWNVFYYNINKKKIEEYNIFDHYGLNRNVEGQLRVFNTNEK